MPIKKIIMFLFFITPVFYQISSLSSFNIEYFQYIPIFLIIILGIPHIKLERNMFIIIVPVLLNYVLIPFFSFNIGKTNIVIEVSNIILYVSMLVLIIIVTTLINNLDEFIKLLRGIIVGNSIIITIYILMNLSSLLDLNNYLWIVSERASRADYGFVHPNSVATFIFLQILLITMLYLFSKRKINFLIIIFYTLSLLATGSRTAVISLTIFFVSYFSIKGLAKLNRHIRITYLATGVIIMFIVTLNYNWSSFWSSTSTRDYLFVSNINYLLTNNKILFGIGPINNTNIKEYFPNVLQTDNWYLNNTILYGILGTAIFAIFLFWRLLVYLKHSIFRKDNNLYIWAASFIIAFIFYNFFETFLYVPGLLISIVFWVLILIINKISQSELKVLS